MPMNSIHWRGPKTFWNAPTYRSRFIVRSSFQFAFKMSLISGGIPTPTLGSVGARTARPRVAWHLLGTRGRAVRAPTHLLDRRDSSHLEILHPFRRSFGAGSW